MVLGKGPLHHGWKLELTIPACHRNESVHRQGTERLNNYTHTAAKWQSLGLGPGRLPPKSKLGPLRTLPAEGLPFLGPHSTPTTPFAPARQALP